MIQITSRHSEDIFIVLENSTNTLRLTRQETIAFLDQLDAACLSVEHRGNIAIADFEMTRSEAEQLRNDLQARLEREDAQCVHDWATEGF